MSNNQNLNNMGEQIKGAVADALKTGDFANLNELVSQTVTDTLHEAGKQFSQNIEINAAKSSKNPSRAVNVPPKKQNSNPSRPVQTQKRQIQPVRQSASLPSVKFKEVGNVSSVLYQVFGGIGLGISGLIAVLRLPAAFLGDSTIGGWIVNILFIIIFMGMIHFGIGQRDRLKRAKRYIQLCGSRMYGQIEQLALDTGTSIRYVARDIRKMLSLGMFPEGHLDSQKTCFMLNDAVHRQYLETANHWQSREKEESQKATAQPESPAPDPEPELNTMIAEGMECIRKLKDLNDRIPGEIISEKLFRLENLLKDIFNSVREHPEQMHRMHTLMDYYLPTTLKLVEAYEDFDKVSSPGDDIINAKAEIERTLDTINEAFAELLNNLFREAVFDATTDAQVLKTMLARDGLSKDSQFIIGGENNEQ